MSIPADRETQEIVEQVDDLLKDALEHGNRYAAHDEVRPSAILALDNVEEARLLLDEIDKREFNGEGEADV